MRARLALPDCIRGRKQRGRGWLELKFVLPMMAIVDNEHPSKCYKQSEKYLTLHSLTLNHALCSFEPLGDTPIVHIMENSSSPHFY